MGNGSVSKTRTRHEIIEDQLKADEIELKRSVKLLLLGSGESGKSTLAKQMKVLKLNGFTFAEKQFFLDHIRRNLVEATVILVEELVAEGCDISDDFMSMTKVIDRWFNDSFKNHVEFNEEIGITVCKLLDSRLITPILAGCQTRFRNLPDSAQYLFGRKNAIVMTDYDPSSDDILRCRIATTGVHEMQFQLDRMTIRLIDVGGQRGQRKKWICQFENVNGMIFVTALSDYYKVLEEDRRTNRMVDSMKLFENLLTSQHFAKTSVLIFFNKKDLFEEKVLYIPMTVCFPDYTGFNNYETASTYIKDQFLSLKPGSKEVYAHFTNATDTANIDYVFKMTFDIIIKQNMRGAGIVI